jgi:pSer/pThr/pTyr-binding forkhead associated (FHA) protein
VKAQLKVVLNGQENFIELPMNIPTTIGRTKKANHLIDDPLMSGVHCRFILKHDRLEIYDMDSKNGVYLNGIKIIRSEIFINDVVKIGNSTINLEPLRMDPNATSTLTFPGPFKERIEHEIKIDYTGAHSVSGKDDFNIKTPQGQAVRKKLIKPAPPTKSEIKKQHKTKAATALIIDTILVISVAGFVPFKILDKMSRLPQVEIGKFVLIKADIDQYKIVILALMIVLLGTIFSLINFRRKGFSIGERMAGIPKLMKD